MQSSQALTTSLSGRPKDSLVVVVPAFKGLVGLFASMLSLRARAEDDIAARYEGRGWNDAIERQMVDDIATMRCGRLWN